MKETLANNFEAIAREWIGKQSKGKSGVRGTPTV